MNKQDCNECCGTGRVVVCQLCVERIPHSSCDDSYDYECDCVSENKKEKEK